jgi:ADP-ribose pyrophosphatase YjhB (NUDIX family)
MSGFVGFYLLRNQRREITELRGHAVALWRESAGLVVGWSTLIARIFFGQVYPISITRRNLYILFSMTFNTSIPEFGIKRENEERRDGGCAVVFDPITQKYAVGKDTAGGLFRLFSGGVDGNENIKQGVLREVVEESGLHDFLHVEQIAEAFTHYHNSLKNVNRVAKATCFLAVLKSTHLMETKLEEHEKFTLEWATSSEILSNWKSRNENKDYDHWIYFLNKSVARARELGYDKRTEVA